MKCLVAFLALVVVNVIGIWMYLSHETTVRGEDLKALAILNATRSYGSWTLYRQNENFYCIKLGKPLVAERYCVPKSDIEIHNAKGGGVEIGTIYSGEIALKENRFPGAKREVF